MAVRDARQRLVASADVDLDAHATVRELRSAGPSLAGVLPVSLVDGGDTLDRVGAFLARAYDALAGGLHERAAASVVKVQAAAEAASTGKMAAVAASAAALATGG